MSEAWQDQGEDRRVSLRIAYITTVAMTIRFLLRDCLFYLRGRGYSVAAVSSPDPWLAELRNAGVPTYAVPMSRRVSPLADLRALKTLVTLFRREHFDIVHTHTPKANP